MNDFAGRRSKRVKERVRTEGWFRAGGWSDIGGGSGEAKAGRN